MHQRKTVLKQGLWFFCFNAVILLLIATRYFRYFSEADSFLTLFYLCITTFSHFTALSFLLFIVYMPMVALFPNRNVAWIWAALLSTLGSVVLLLDTYVFDLYRMHINRFVLELLFGGAGSQIFEFHIRQYLLSYGLVVLLSAIMLYVSYKFFRWKAVHSFRKGWWIAGCTALMMFGTHFIHAWAEAANYTPITKSSRTYPLFFPTADRDLMMRLGFVSETESRNTMLLAANHKSAELNYPQHAIVSDSNSKTNIVFIIIDSWYYKSFDSVAMPNIYNFSKECSVYNKHYSGSNGTRTGIFSLFYGIPGTYWDIVLATLTGPVFMDVLLKNQYQVKAYTSASLISPPFDRTVFRKIKKLQFETPGEHVFNRDIRLTSDWLAQTAKYNSNITAKPVFSFLFYDALHAISHPPDFKGPFQPEWSYAKYEMLNNDIDPTPFLNLYKNSAFFVDSLVGRVLAGLKEKGLLENSWVIITGDHGQEFNDNHKNYWGHNGNYSAAQMQVPMMIYKPGGSHKIYDHWTSHYDIVPTILTDLFHCKNPISDYSIGKHINDTTDRKWLLVGSSDNYAILQPDRISSVYFDGSFDITDRHLNPVKDDRLQTDLINRIFSVTNSFYNK